jgi:hypothetical protein
MVGRWIASGWGVDGGRGECMKEEMELEMWGKWEK